MSSLRGVENIGVPNAAASSASRKCSSSLSEKPATRSSRAGSEAEAYLRSLGEGTLMGPPDQWGSQAQRTPALSAEDYAALRALSDIARVLVEREDNALRREWVTRTQQGGTTDIYGGGSAGTSGTNRFAGSPYTGG